MARYHSRAAALVCFLLLGPLVFSANPDPADGPRFEPDSLKKDAPELRGATWVAAGEGFTLRLQLIDAAQRLAYIEHTTGLTTDPFASKPGQPARYMTFVLEVENTGEMQLQFNPRKCWLMTNRKKIQTPLMMTDLSFQYRQIGSEIPAAYERVSEVLFEHATAVEPGRSAAGLLAFRPVVPKTKSFHVDARVVLGTGEVGAISAPYARVKSRKNGNKDATK